MRRFLTLTLLAVLVLAALFVCLGTSRGDLIYEGKPLGQWLDGGFEDASRALYDLGPAAADSVFAKLKREHPQYSYWGRYRSVWDKLPPFCRKFLPKPRAVGFDEWRACNALLAIGPRVIPSLGSALGDRNFLVRRTSAQTLGYFQKRGADIRVAIPALRLAVRDSDPAVRQLAAADLADSPAANQGK